MFFSLQNFNAEMNKKKLEFWVGNSKKPFIISGPCSAESEEQMLNTANLLAETGKVHMLRAGIWKPRTRPNSFEGKGKIALEWLKKAGNAANLPTCCEVANAAHVEEALKAGIDALWIGARSSVSPFAVQEIADALKGVDIPVMVKNPVNPDLNLWIGALERLDNAGIKNLAAIHRGFSSFENSKFRNAPMWEFPIELKIKLPEIPIICDPSHISGDKGLILEISQKAMDLNMDGLMVETHENPSKAWSDPHQQLTPNQLNELLERLIVRNVDGNNGFKNHLEELRSKIDFLDEQIIEKISSRMAIAEKIGEYKKENNMTILQLERWKNIIKDRSMLGKSTGLSEEFVLEILKLVHNESIRIQTETMNNNKNGIEL